MHENFDTRLLGLVLVEVGSMSTHGRSLGAVFPVSDDLTPPTLLEILASSLTNILPSLTKLHLSPKPVNITFINFAVSGLTSIPQLPIPLLPLSFTPSLITVMLSTINSLSLNYLVSSRSRTLLLLLWLDKSCHITPILCFLH